VHGAGCDRGERPGVVVFVERRDALHDGVLAPGIDDSGKTPLLLTESWIPASIAGDLVTPSNVRRRALFELLQESGVRFGHVVQEISAAIADPLAARLLAVPIGSPLIRIERLVHDDGGRPVQLAAITASPDRTRIVSEFDAEELDTVASGILAHRALRKRHRAG
jgi:GntR family transcriptional regulator